MIRKKEAAIKICEVRRFVKSFIVYVNTPKDVERLSNHMCFKQHAVYKENKKVVGGEFAFKCNSHTLSGAKKFVRGILYDRIVSEKASSGGTTSD